MSAFLSWVAPARIKSPALLVPCSAHWIAEAPWHFITVFMVMHRLVAPNQLWLFEEQFCCWQLDSEPVLLLCFHFGAAVWCREGTEGPGFKHVSASIHLAEASLSNVLNGPRLCNWPWPLTFLWREKKEFLNRDHQLSHGCKFIKWISLMLHCWMWMEKCQSDVYLFIC